MKLIFSVLFILLQFKAFANMANPVRNGTLGSRPFVNQYVDVTHEDLFIKIGKDFKYASFNIKYHINSSMDGFQIPFLFYASEYLDSFIVKIDGKEVVMKDISYDFKVPDSTKFKDFSYFFEKGYNNESSTVTVQNSLNSGFIITLQNMIYFETDLSKGHHVIEVSYRATKWTDSSDWIKEYSFRYALSPAKYWKSFGTLTIKIDATDFSKELSTNLGAPKSGSFKAVADWEFNKIPTEILQINYTPKVSKTAQKLMNHGPFQLAYFTGIILMIVHLAVVIWYRKKNPRKKYSLPLIIGCVLIPFIVLFCWVNYYDLIDSYIGTHAGKSHGYTFFVMALYPIIMPGYLLISWLIDQGFKWKFNRQQENNQTPNDPII